jgi:hypothetical protein
MCASLVTQGLQLKCRQIVASLPQGHILNLFLVTIHPIVALDFSKKQSYSLAMKIATKNPDIYLKTEMVMTETMSIKMPKV